MAMSRIKKLKTKAGYLSVIDSKFIVKPWTWAWMEAYDTNMTSQSDFHLRNNILANKVGIPSGMDFTSRNTYGKTWEGKTLGNSLG